jgi:hypothetical protein
MTTKSKTEKLTFAYLLFADGRLCRVYRSLKSAIANFVGNSTYREDSFRRNNREISAFVTESGHGTGTVWTVEKHVMCG